MKTRFTITYMIKSCSTSILNLMDDMLATSWASKKNNNKNAKLLRQVRYIEIIINKNTISANHLKSTVFFSFRLKIFIFYGEFKKHICILYFTDNWIL